MIPHNAHSSLKVPHRASQWNPCICCTLSTLRRDENNRPDKGHAYQWGHRPVGRGGRPNLPFFLGSLAQTTSPQRGLPWSSPSRQWWPFPASWVLHPGPTILQSTHAVSSFRLCAPLWMGFYVRSALCSPYPYCLLARGSTLLSALPKLIHLILTPTLCSKVLILCTYYRWKH